MSHKETIIRPLTEARIQAIAKKYAKLMADTKGQLEPWQLIHGAIAFSLAEATSAESANEGTPAEPENPLPKSRGHRERPLNNNVQNFDSLPDASFINIHVVCGVTGLSKASIWRAIGKTAFPRPKKFGKASRWNVKEVRECLASNGIKL